MSLTGTVIIHKLYRQRVRFQDLETVCGIDLGEVFGQISREYTRIMHSGEPDDTLVSPFSLQQQGFSPSQRVEATPVIPVVVKKPSRWNVMPTDRRDLYEIFTQVQQDALFFAQSGVHILKVDDPLRAEHAAICLATEHVLKTRSIEVF